jgi:diaminopimelate decarboxylase
LPWLDEGDAVAFLDAGAYNLALWWQFITYRPAVVLLGPGGEVDVVRAAETFESVTERERLPDRLR